MRRTLTSQKQNDGVLLTAPHGTKFIITCPTKFGKELKGNTQTAYHIDNVPCTVNNALSELCFSEVKPNRIFEVLQSEKWWTDCERTTVSVDELGALCTKLYGSGELKLDFTRLVQIWISMYDNELSKLDDAKSLFVCGSGRALIFQINNNFQGKKEHAEEAMKRLIASSDDTISRDQFIETAKAVVIQAISHHENSSFPEKVPKEFKRAVQGLSILYDFLRWPYNTTLTTQHGKVVHILYRKKWSPDEAIDVIDEALRRIFCKSLSAGLVFDKFSELYKNEVPLSIPHRIVANAIESLMHEEKIELDAYALGDYAKQRFKNLSRGSQLYIQGSGASLLRELSLMSGKIISQDEAIVFLKARSNALFVNATQFSTALSDITSQSGESVNIHVKVTKSFSLPDITWDQAYHILCIVAMFCTVRFMLLIINGHGFFSSIMSLLLLSIVYLLPLAIILLIAICLLAPCTDCI